MRAAVYKIACFLYNMVVSGCPGRPRKGDSKHTMTWYYLSYILILPGILLAFGAQMAVRRTYAKYSQHRSRSGLTGAQAAAMILHQHRVEDVAVTPGEGTLSDHYDPRQKVIRLSPDIFNGDSIAAVSIAAHEASHAVQHAEGYFGFTFRSFLFPVANIGSSLAIPMVFIGIIISAFDFLIPLGLVLFAFAVLFHLVTLPVELNASKRALDSIKMEGVLSVEEAQGARGMLTAAAFTYVAALIVALLQFLRLLLLSRRN